MVTKTQHGDKNKNGDKNTMWSHKYVWKFGQTSTRGGYERESNTASGFSYLVPAKLVTFLYLEAFSLTGFCHDGR